MIKDISPSLVAAVTAINQKSREAFVAEQAAQKKPKLPGVPAPKADPAAVNNAKKMAEEAEGTTPKTEKEKKLAALAEPKGKITHADVMKGRGVTKEEKEESAAHEKAEKGNNPFDWKNYKSRIAKKPGETTGHDSKKISTGTVYTKKEVKEENVEEGLMDKIKKISQKAIKTISHGSDEDLIKDLQKKTGVPQTGKKPVVKEENMDTPGNSTHQCAIHVKSEQYGEGIPLTSQHAEPDAEGKIAWYDVMFAEGIKRVETKDIEILETCNHGNHTKKKAK